MKRNLNPFALSKLTLNPIQPIIFSVNRIASGVKVDCPLCPDKMGREMWLNQLGSSLLSLFQTLLMDCIKNQVETGPTTAQFHDSIHTAVLPAHRQRAASWPPYGSWGDQAGFHLFPLFQIWPKHFEFNDHRSRLPVAWSLFTLKGGQWL